MPRTMHVVREQAIRVDLGIPLKRAAKLAGVSHATLRVYEADPQAVKSELLRMACAALYDELRALMAREPLRETCAHQAAE